MRSKNDWWNYLEHRIKSDRELYHHGVLGMKWGVRRYQSYSTVPRKSGKPGKEIGDARKLNRKEKNITVGMSRISNMYNRVNYRFGNDFKPYYEEQSTRTLGDQDYREVEKRVSPDGTIKYPPVGAVIRDALVNGDENPYPGPKGFDGLYDRVNPDYGEPGTTNNCLYVAAAMELASKGYDIVARRSLGGASVGSVERWFNDAESIRCSNWNSMKKEILFEGDGASGVLNGFYGDGLESGMGGHALHYRNEKGKIIVADGQNHSEMDFDSVQEKYGFNPGTCVRTRLDDCTPNWDNIASDGVIGVPGENRRWEVTNNDLKRMGYSEDDFLNKTGSIYGSDYWAIEDD